MNKHILLTLALIIALAAQGCSLVGKPKPALTDTSGPVSGVYHTVQTKESLWRISKAYGVSLQDVAEINNIKNTSQIKKGDRIFIPGVSKTVKLTAADKADTTPPEKIVSHPGLFIWPVRGKVIEEYGMYGGIKHDGINIKAPDGTPVKAAKEGTVAFSGTLEGYGNTIIIEHKDKYATVYANNKKNLVKQGQTVRKGETIAEVGAAATIRPVTYLHFQIRSENKPRNPRFYLPKA